jgi:hypothetical protein
LTEIEEVVAPVDHKYEPPGKFTVEETFTKLPEHTELVAGIETVGTGLTVTTEVAGVAAQPFAVYETVYEVGLVVEVGETVIVEPVCPDDHV